jgi:hypothetical protein
MAKIAADILKYDQLFVLILDFVDFFLVISPLFFKKMVPLHFLLKNKN